MQTCRLISLWLGPTASGKSAAALELAERLGYEIVSIDSAQVYRGMDIGTAKPSLEERQRVPHHLIDLIEPHEPYSVARFARDCAAAITDIERRGARPLLVGGTMMYADCLLRGMSELPPTDPAVRAEFEAECERLGLAALHARLAELDPSTAARLAPGDRQRILRALEVERMTGQPLSALQGSRRSLLDRRFRVLLWQPEDRAWLHARCAERLQRMFAQGFIDEVKSLQGRYGLSLTHASMRAVGYRQVLEGLASGASQAVMAERALYATRQLAKRQLTWMRGMPGQVIACDKPDAPRQAERWLMDHE